MFRHQFEAVAGHNNWAPWEKATHLLAILQGQAADVLYSVPAKVMYEEIIMVPESCYGDYQLAMAYHD
jgi:hypothetical protein